MSDLDPHNVTQFAKNQDKGTAKDLRDQIGDAGAEMKQRAGDAFQASADLARDKFREAGRAFETDVPFAARGMYSAADYVEDAALKIRDGSFRDLVEGATDFAKRQPAAFLGLTVLAGFAAVRFLKASGGRSSQGQRDMTEASPSGSGQISGAASFPAGDRPRAQEATSRTPHTQQASSFQGSTVP